MRPRSLIGPTVLVVLLTPIMIGAHYESKSELRPSYHVLYKVQASEPEGATVNGQRVLLPWEDRFTARGGDHLTLTASTSAPAVCSIYVDGGLEISQTIKEGTRCQFKFKLPGG